MFVFNLTHKLNKTKNVATLFFYTEKQSHACLEWCEDEYIFGLTAFHYWVYSFKNAFLHLHTSVRLRIGRFCALHIGLSIVIQRWKSLTVWGNISVYVGAARTVALWSRLRLYCWENPDLSYIRPLKHLCKSGLMCPLAEAWCDQCTARLIFSHVVSVINESGPLLLATWPFPPVKGNVTVTFDSVTFPQ